MTDTRYTVQFKIEAYARVRGFANTLEITVPDEPAAIALTIEGLQALTAMLIEKISQCGSPSTEKE